MAQHLYLYESISERLRCHIRQGNYRSGERLPSVRSLSRLFKVSINTITQCFRQLEADGFIKVRPRSGVFVADDLPAPPQHPAMAHFPLLPVEVSLSEDILRFMEPHARADLVHFGIALPSPELMAVDRALKTMREVTRTHALESWDYTHPHGHERFTHQLSRRSINYPVPIDQNELLVTNGCMEGIGLALQALTKPGDIVAVETPTYYGTLLALGVMQRRVLEIPTHYRDGICLYSLEQAFKRGQVRACLLSTNAQNPLGFTMSAERKRRLVALAVKYDVPIIENDIWGDTVYTGEALPAKAYDETGMVIYCNSFSKTLMPGLRLGWIAPGRYHHRIRELKQISSITTASVPQLMMARLMESGFYAQHIQQLRTHLASQAEYTANLVAEHFPAHTRAALPTGGCALWIGLPGGKDSRVLFDQALAAGIHIFPGNVFSAGPRHYDCLRLNAGNPPSERNNYAIARLGEIVAKL
jgi:DNA-binding transcriptional MocR family regulator